MAKETHKQMIKRWEGDCRKHLVGKTIAEVRYLTDKEMQDMYWTSRSLVIFFTDKTYIYASADDEGNDAGALFTGFKDLPVIPVIGY